MAAISLSIDLNTQARLLATFWLLSGRSAWQPVGINLVISLVLVCLSAEVDIPCKFITHSYTSMTVHALSRQRQRTCIQKRAQGWSDKARSACSLLRRSIRQESSRSHLPAPQDEPPVSKSSEKRTTRQTAQGMEWATKCRETDLHLLPLITANRVKIRMPSVLSTSVVFCQRKLCGHRHISAGVHWSASTGAVIHCGTESPGELHRAIKLSRIARGGVAVGIVDIIPSSFQPRSAFSSSSPTPPISSLPHNQDGSLSN
jgi:hypothetical protein